MSGALGALATLSGVGQQALAASGALSSVSSALGSNFAFLSAGARSIDTLVPDCTISESHTDRVQITQHPVADNTPVSDHAFVLPKTVVMRVGWSNANAVGSITQGAISGFQSGGFGGALTGGLSGAWSSVTEQRVKTVYDDLVAKMEKRTPFTLVTGKRTYSNKMLISQISVTTDHTTEFSLMAEVHFQEVILVQTQTTAAPAQQTQSAPQQTSSSTDQPDKQSQPFDPVKWLTTNLKPYLPSWLFSPSSSGGGGGGGASP
jgi:hypothetical protein